MNFVKKKVGKGLHVPQMADVARDIGKSGVSGVQNQFPVLNQRLPQRDFNDSQRKEMVAKIENIAKGLDNIFPWSPIPIGLGSVLGFVPFIGGTLGSLLSLYQIYLSCTLGIPAWLLMRMLVNIGIAFLLSLIPFVGGLFHMFYRSNIYNYEELSEWFYGHSKSDSNSGNNNSGGTNSGGGSTRSNDNSDNMKKVE